MIGIRAAATAAVVAALALAPGPSRADDPSQLAIGLGAMDFDHSQAAGELRVEYRFAQGYYFIKPVLGVFGTSSDSVYAYAGLRAEFVLADHYVIMPVAAFGYYDQGNGKNLGSHLEFKTGVEFAWRFDNAMRLGIAFDHISNAGITKRNPGTENLLLVYSLPLGD